MRKDEEYGRLAARAQILADTAKSPRERAAWQEVSECWLALLEQTETSSDVFSHESADESSMTSH